MSAEPARTASPLTNDRLPMHKRVTLLSERGYWPQIESLAKRHGWGSTEVVTFIDAHLPKADCPICGTPFYDYSRRVKYCSDKCRRKAAALLEHGHESPAKKRVAPATPKPVLGPDDQCVRLEREAAGRRIGYVLLVTCDLFGVVALTRRWGKVGTHRWRQVTRQYATLEDALAAMYVCQERQLQRGYTVRSAGRGGGNAVVCRAGSAALAKEARDAIR